VYLTPRLPDAYGVAHTWLPTPAPTWIELRENLPFHGKLPPGLAQVLAHEMTHACQNSYAHGASYVGNRWIYEGTATWGEDHVYPTRNSEQMRAAQLLEYAWLPIDDEWSNRPYSTYLLFQLLTRGNQDDDLIERIFSGFEGKAALAAVDEALPSLEGHPAGFEVWLRPFAAAAWNQDPSAPFWSNDGLEVKGKPMAPALPLTIAGGELVTMTDVRVPQLGLWEYQFDLTDPTVRQVAFWDGWYYALEQRSDEGGDYYGPQPGSPPSDDRPQHAITTVLVKRRDAWTQLAIPGLGGSLVCQDDPADRADALMISFANAYPFQYKLGRPGKLDPTLVLSNLGCYRWEGTVSGVSSPATDQPVEETSATVSWQRETLASQAGQNFFTPALVHATWRISGSDGTCTYDGSDAWTDSGLTAGGLFFAMQYISGPWHRAYRAVGGGHVVTYRVTCPDGQGGQHVTTVQKPVFWIDTSKASDQAWRPKASADGLLLSGSADDGEMVWTWSFTSAPGP
jgi:hypothetical protein